MTPESQQIAIAESMGFVYDSILEAWYKDGHYYFTCGDDLNYNQLPDYLNDLNAMHEVEKSLSDEQFWDYLACLGIVVGGLYPEVATSAQRAEAYLKTIGKWEDK